MPTLAFFPWLQLNGGIQSHGFRIVPYERGSQPGGDIQAVADAILGSYRESRKRPVDRAALLVCEPTALGDSLSPEQRLTAFEFADIVKMGGLSARSYDQFGYANASVFTLIIQDFKDETGGVLVNVRMRHGLSGHYYSKGVYECLRPAHTAIGGPALIDAGLVDALLEARETDLWARCSPAIVLFAAANTDIETTPERSELVEMVSAFESLLGQHNAKPLASAFKQLWAISKQHLGETGLAWSKRFDKDWLTLDAWLYDLYDARNNSAHAGLGKATTWTVHEHLFFGAIALPLLLKRVLAEAGLIVVSDKDVALIDGFEELLSTQPFKERALGDPPPWRKYFERAGWKAAVNSAQTQALAQSIEDALDDSEGAG